MERERETERQRVNNEIHYRQMKKIFTREVLDKA